MKAERTCEPSAREEPTMKTGHILPIATVALLTAATYADGFSIGFSYNSGDCYVASSAGSYVYYDAPLVCRSYGPTVVYTYPYFRYSYNAAKKHDIVYYDRDGCYPRTYGSTFYYTPRHRYYGRVYHYPRHRTYGTRLYIGHGYRHGGSRYYHKDYHRGYTRGHRYYYDRGSRYDHKGRDRYYYGTSHKSGNRHYGYHRTTSKHYGGTRYYSGGHRTSGYKDSRTYRGSSGHYKGSSGRHYSGGHKGSRSYGGSHKGRGGAHKR